jgi:hypothetical protein
MKYAKKINNLKNCGLMLEIPLQWKNQILTLPQQNRKKLIELLSEVSQNKKNVFIESIINLSNDSFAKFNGFISQLSTEKFR